MDLELMDMTDITKPRQRKRKITASRAERMIKRRMAGATLQQIADEEGVSIYGVHSAIRREIKEKDLAELKNAKVLIMEHLQGKMLSMINEPDIMRKILVRRGLADYKILYEVSRLEQGLSTENISIAYYDAPIEKLSKEIQELERIIGRTPNAITEGQESAGGECEHRDVEGGGLSTEAGGSHSTEEGRVEQEEKEVT